MLFTSTPYKILDLEVSFTTEEKLKMHSSATFTMSTLFFFFLLLLTCAVWVQQVKKAKRQFPVFITVWLREGKHPI